MNNNINEEPIVELALPDGPFLDNEEILDISVSRLGGAPVLTTMIEIPKCGSCKCSLFFILQMDCPLPDVDRILYVFACNTAKCSTFPEAWLSYFHYFSKTDERNEQISKNRRFGGSDFELTEKALSSLQISESSSETTVFSFQDFPRQFPCISLKICEEFWNEPSYKKNTAKMAFIPPITPATGEDADVYEKILPAGIDKKFEYFQKRVAAYPRQCVRYSPGGKLLPFSVKQIPAPPPCPTCHSPRKFDLQLMPAILHYLPVSKEKYLVQIPKEFRSNHPLFGDEMQWGTVFIYSCQSACYRLGRSSSASYCIIQQEND
jgi:pre-rRNA-processing protein TSR4